MGPDPVTDLNEDRVREICEQAGVSLRDYVEALLTTRDAATILAEAEREKAASALRDQLTERIATGDSNLREHITQQIAQLKQLVDSAERLELSRFEAIDDRVTQLNAAGHAQIEQRVAGVEREVMIRMEAADKAISKAEESTKKQFESVNEFRSEARAVREAQQAALAALTATFMPREVYQAAHDQLIERVAALERISAVGEGRTRGIGVTSGVIVTIVTVAVAILGLIIVFANYAASQ